MRRFPIFLSLVITCTLHFFAIPHGSAMDMFEMDDSGPVEVDAPGAKDKTDEVITLDEARTLYVRNKSDHLINLPVADSCQRSTAPSFPGNTTEVKISYPDSDLDLRVMVETEPYERTERRYSNASGHTGTPHSGRNLSMVTQDVDEPSSGIVLAQPVEPDNSPFGKTVPRSNLNTYTGEISYNLAFWRINEARHYLLGTEEELVEVLPPKLCCVIEWHNPEKEALKVTFFNEFPKEPSTPTDNVDAK